MPEQPKPTESSLSQPVRNFARNRWTQASIEQQNKGITKYGTELMTFNGRDAAADCRSELVDAHRYLTQLEMEREAIETAARGLLEALDRALCPLPSDEQCPACWWAAELRTALGMEDSHGS